jgi:ribosomal protein L11 methyltransferase
MTFYEIEFPLAALSSETVEAALFEVGASSITFVDRGDEPVLEPLPGEVRLWSDTLVRALFQESPASPDATGTPTATGAVATGAVAAGAVIANAAATDCAVANAVAATDVARRLSRLATLLGPQVTETARVRGVADQEWERIWLSDWKSMRFGRRLWVCPTAAELPADPDAVVVRLDPGLAFGTGTHPTTALCLQILDSLPVSGRRLIDYGCGSGILGIAALKLGAAHVTAVDLDPQALLATRDNAIRNGVSSNIDVQGIEPGLRPAYCVLANILAGPLIELAPKLTAACEPGGYLLLSGLLKTQAYAVKAAYSSAFDMVQVVERDDWCCIYARRGA